MIRFVIIVIITLSSGLFSCCENKEKDFVFDEFKSQITAHGMKIDSVDETGLIYISKGEETLKASLDNVRRNYLRDNDETHISDFVQTLLVDPPELPASWVEVKDKIFVSLFQNDYDFKDILHYKITDMISKIFVYDGQGYLSWIGADDLVKWKITESDLVRQANENADKLLAKTEIGFDTIENRRLGLIETEQTSLKSALLFAPAMKEKLKKDFGFPYYAVIPVRDFCYIFSEKDYSFFSDRIGTVVVDEFKNSGYPITTEILKFSDNGVEAVGKYPTD